MTAPGFLRLAGHPLRWRLLSELARSDRQVRELKALLGQPQNLVSYHLARLRAGGLVAARRSSADGRDAYYTSTWPGAGSCSPRPGRRCIRGCGCARLLGGRTGAGEGAVLVYGQQCPLPDGAALPEHVGRRYGSRAASAGSHPKPLHPTAVRVMAERGIDISSRHSARHLSSLAAERSTT